MNTKLDIPVVLVDSECAICNRSVKFIRKNSSSRAFLFRSLYTEEGKEFLIKYGFPENYNKSLILIEHNKAYTRTTAALRIAKKMNGAFPALYALIIIPRPVRDLFYNLLARHRYQLNP